jgi:hypothetical protein
MIAAVGRSCSCCVCIITSVQLHIQNCFAVILRATSDAVFCKTLLNIALYKLSYKERGFACALAFSAHIGQLYGPKHKYILLHAS